MMLCGLVATQQAVAAPPEADAGSDQEVTDNDGTGTETVTLDGSGSSDSDGSITSWVWKEGTSQIAMGETAEVSLSIRLHEITLVVTDDQAGSDSDTVNVRVYTAPPPVALDLSDGFNTDAICGALEFQEIYNYAGTYDPNKDLKELQGSYDEGVGWYVVARYQLAICATSEAGFGEPYSLPGWGSHPAYKTDAQALPEDGVITGAERTYHMASHVGNATLSGDWTQVADPSAGPPESIPNMATVNNVMYVYSFGDTASGQVISTTATLPGGQQGTYSDINFVLGASGHTDGGRNMRIVAVYSDESEDILYSFSTADERVGPCIDDSLGDVYTSEDFNVVEQFTVIYNYTWTETGNAGTDSGSLFEFADPLALNDSKTLVGIRLEDCNPSLNGSARGLTIFAASAFSTDTSGFNLDPVADAGADDEVEDTDDDSYETVTLDGSASSDPDGDIASWVWKEGTTQIATGQTTEVVLGVGEHEITLIVTDNEEATDSDTVIMTVTAASGYNTYYVDYDDGSDSNNGLSTLTPFKHCPGDPNATGMPDSTSLSYGDTVIFKGGVFYRGQIRCEWGGSSGHPITYDGNTADTWGTGRAIIDGSEPITGWTQCTSAEEVDGNPDYASIYWTYAETGVTAMGCDMFEDDGRLHVAQDPNISDPFYYDELSEYNQSDSQTDTTIVDEDYFTDEDEEYWDGSTYIHIWAGNNAILTRAVTGYDPQSNKIQHASLGTSFYDKYAMVNSLKILDTAGEYVVREDQTGPGGGPKVYMWPLTPGVSGKVFSITVAEHSFYVYKSSYITIEGFKLQRSTDEHPAICAHTTTSLVDITVEDNIIMDHGLSGIVIGEATNTQVIDNQVKYCRGLGILLTTSSNSSVRDNYCENNKRTGVCFYGMTNSKIIGNTITDNLGLHANGIAVYLDSDGVDVIGNFVTEGRIALTLQRADNVLIAYNVLHTDIGLYAFAAWNDCDTVGMYNNVIQNTYRPASALELSSTANTNFVAKNNISGASNLWKYGTSEYNLYTSVGDGQELGTGEFEADAADLWVDPANFDYHLKSGSPAIDAGVDVGLTEDFDGNPVYAGSAPDLGVYESGAAPPEITAWHTLADHGGQKIATVITDNQIDSRNEGPKKLRIHFTTPLDPDTVNSGALTITGDASGDVSSLISDVALVDGTKIVVILSSGLASGDRYTLTVNTSVTSPAEQAVGGDRNIRLGVLSGDVDGSGGVTLSDMLAIRARVGLPLDQTTVWFDIDGSGQITGADMRSVRRSLGNALP